MSRLVGQKLFYPYLRLWDDLPLKSGSLPPCQFFVGISTGGPASVYKLPRVSILFYILRTVYLTLYGNLISLLKRRNIGINIELFSLT